MGIILKILTWILDIIIEKLKILEFIDFSISNEEIHNSKPHSEIYLKCFLALRVNPKESLVLEDSAVGRKSAYNSGAHVMEINVLNDIKLEKIKFNIETCNSQSKKIKWKSENLNILIPIAGRGQRFIDKGYAFPKPLISIKNKPELLL